MGKKIPASVSQGTPKKKARTACFGVPSVAEMGQLTTASGSIPRPRFDDGITIELFRYCTCASVYSEAWDDNELAVLSFACDEQPSPLFYFMKVLELHGESTKESKTPEPITREEIQVEYNACFQFVSRKIMEQDRDQSDWRKNGLGAYVWGGPAAVKNFLMFIDDVVSWRTTFSDAIFEPLAAKPKIIIHVPSDYMLKLDTAADELKCTFEVKTVPSGKLTVFDVPPPTFPLRTVVLTFELVSDTSAHAIFSGNTKPFQSGFGNLKIRGTSMKLQTTDAYAEFFRVCEPAFDLEKLMLCTQELKLILGDGCLKSSPVIVRIKNTRQCDTTALIALVESLNECVNVRFDV